MAEGVNVRITGKLQRFIEEQASPNGLYESASEYVRDIGCQPSIQSAHNKSIY